MNIDFDRSKIVKEIHIRWADYGASAKGRLIAGKEVKSPLDIPNEESVSVITVGSQVSAISLRIEGDMARVIDYTVIYNDSSLRELNSVNYDFSLPYYNKQEMFKWSENIGDRYLVLLFFGTWCSSCHERLPVVSKLAEKYPYVNFVAVSAGNSGPDVIQEMFDTLEVNLECIVDPEYNVCAQLNVIGVPEIKIFDLDGNLVKEGNLKEPELVEFLDSIDRNERSEVGEPLEDFTLEYYDNEDTYTLSENVGEKNTLLLFFTTWCTVCRLEIPAISEKAHEFTEKTRIIAVAAGEKKEDVKTFFKEKGIDLECLVDTDYKLIKQLGLTAVPQQILLDVKGNVIFNDNKSHEEIFHILGNL
ncbi:MAG: hypothetical protein C0601_13580 [Candidatus Muiribacterium halophilum]|uniref:Thioredoxin domain-containing protein n=1 Tax=Muiribacterium halophilum TaxID=2053465 RepID=A0A2N5Z920_MUIH1|nr:MAG: hypothetical protein C0601_13580 [Candidatus Muirbacterium halophilum]